MATLALKDVLSRANNKLNVSGMDKDVANITRDVIEEMHEQGIYVGVAQAYRSKAEQDALYAKGRRGVAGEKIVTNAKGGQSNHNYGVAVDLFVYPGTFGEAEFLQPSDARMKKIVASMKKHGMKWGGDWSSFPDYPHFELYDAYRGQSKPSVSTESSKPASSTSTHKVVSGDTLSELAEKYGVTVAELKSWNGLKGDQIDVNDTLKVKKPEAPKPATPTNDDKAIVPYPGSPLYVGAKGMKVKDINRVQRAVGAVVSDKFTTGTANKIKAYQKRKGLAVDGVVGKDTWNMLF